MVFNSDGENTVVVVFDGMKLQRAQLNDEPIILEETLTNITKGTGQKDITNEEENKQASGGRRKKSAKRNKKPKRKKTAKRRK